MLWRRRLDFKGLLRKHAPLPSGYPSQQCPVAFCQRAEEGAE